MDLTIIIAIAEALFTGMLIFYFQRSQRLRDERKEALDDARKKESLLLLELVMASAKLSYACAMALKRGEPNGEVEEGVKAYKEAKVKYYKFLNEQAKGYLE